MVAREEWSHTVWAICVLPDRHSSTNLRVGGRETEMTQGSCRPNEHNDGLGRVNKTSIAPRCIPAVKSMTTYSEAGFSARDFCSEAFNPCVALNLHHWVNIYVFLLSIYFVLRSSWKGSENEHR
jgi:hypothetical protein